MTPKILLLHVLLVCTVTFAVSQFVPSRQDLHEMLKSLNETLTDKMNQLTSKLDALTSSLTILTGNVGTLTTNIGTQSSNMNTLTRNVDKLTTKVDDLTSDFDTNVDKLTTKVDDLTSDVDRNVDILSTKVDDLTRNVDTLKSKVNGISPRLDDLQTKAQENQEKTAKSVSFHAWVDDGPYKARDTLTAYRTINNDGNAYNETSGMFTVPVSGTYIFLANVIVAAYSPRKINDGVFIYVDGKVHGRCWSSYKDHHEQGSCHAIVKLRAGQRVWLHNYYDDCFYYSDSSTFSGALLHADLS